MQMVVATFCFEETPRPRGIEWINAFPRNRDGVQNSTYDGGIRAAP